MINVPKGWTYTVELDKTGKFLTLNLFVDFELEKELGYRAKRFTINALFDCYEFRTKQIQLILIRLLESLNEKYYTRIEIRE